MGGQYRITPTDILLQKLHAVVDGKNVFDEKKTI